MFKKIIHLGLIAGCLTLGAGLAHGETALEQLQRANDGKTTTGQTFDGSGSNSGGGTIDTTVQPSSGTASGVSPSSGTAGGYGVAPSSGTATAPSGGDKN